MKERLQVVCFAVLMLLFLSAESCNSLPVIRILTPKPGLDATYEPLLLEIDLWGFADTDTFEVLLNDVDITSAFELSIVDHRILATAMDVWGPGVVDPVSNDLVVRIEQWQVTRTFSTSGDPHADEVVDFVPGTGAGFGQSELPQVVTGSPAGLGLFLGGLDVLSLGSGGTIELAFSDNVILDGPGVDFTVFENPFLTVVLGIVGNPFAEPGRVSVSQDGNTWFVFDACSTAPLDPPLYAGCAGVYPTLSDPDDPLTAHPSIPSESPITEWIGLSQGQIASPEGSGGDSFDLEDVGLTWARFVRIEDVGPALGQAGSLGFDLDAVTAVNSGVTTDADQNGVPDCAE